MTIDWTKPIETMDGQPARVLATDLAYHRPVVVAVASKGADHEAVWLLTSEGAYDTDRPLMVRNVPPDPIVRYINMYPNGCRGRAHESRAKADNSAGSSRIACVRVEFKEGQFDE